MSGSESRLEKMGSHEDTKSTKRVCQSRDRETRGGGPKQARLVFSRLRGNCGTRRGRNIFVFLVSSCLRVDKIIAWNYGDSQFNP